MTSEKKDILVPFDEDGNMIDYYYGYRKGDYKAGDKITRTQYNREIGEYEYDVPGGEWRANYDFIETFAIISADRGRSAVRFTLVDTAGHEFTMGLGPFVRAIKAYDVIDGNITGRWTFIKRGCNWSLSPYEEGTDE